MDDRQKKAARRMRVPYFLFLPLILLVCILCFYALSRSSTRLALSSSTSLNRQYLKEMTAQMLSGRFSSPPTALYLIHKM